VFWIRTHELKTLQKRYLRTLDSVLLSHAREFVSKNNGVRGSKNGGGDSPALVVADDVQY
jgi:hypothetical protein